MRKPAKFEELIEREYFSDPMRKFTMVCITIAVSVACCCIAVVIIAAMYSDYYTKQLRMEHELKLYRVSQEKSSSVPSEGQTRDVILSAERGGE